MFMFLCLLLLFTSEPVHGIKIRAYGVRSKPVSSRPELSHTRVSNLGTAEDKKEAVEQAFADACANKAKEIATEAISIGNKVALGGIQESIGLGLILEKTVEILFNELKKPVPSGQQLMNLFGDRVDEMDIEEARSEVADENVVVSRVTNALAELKNDPNYSRVTSLIVQAGADATKSLLKAAATKCLAAIMALFLPVSFSLPAVAVLFWVLHSKLDLDVDVLFEAAANYIIALGKSEIAKMGKTHPVQFEKLKVKTIHYCKTIVNLWFNDDADDGSYSDGSDVSQWRQKCTQIFLGSNNP